LGGEPTFAEAVVNSEVAPKPAVRKTAMEPRGSTQSGHMHQICAPANQLIRQASGSGAKSLIFATPHRGAPAGL
jgi:hypothetical protein